MTPSECPREQDVLDALAALRWPHRCDDELRDHVASCEVCGDLVEVARALIEESRDDHPGIAVPPASVVWWRAQLRAREDAARAAARPLRVALQLALACVIAVLILGLVALAPAVRSALPDPASWTPSIGTQGARDAALAMLASRGVQLAAAAWLVLGPVAVYLALTED